MLINWFTVCAQAFNFLILVWLLKRFLFKPIFSALDEREKKIAAELENADKKKAEAEQQSNEFIQKNDEFDRQRVELMSHAADEAKAERQRIIDNARKEAESLSAKWRNKMQNDANNLNQAIQLQTQQEIFSVARKVLKDIAAVNIEETLGEVFTRRLHELDGQAKAVFAAALKTASDPAILRSQGNRIKI